MRKINKEILVAISLFLILIVIMIDDSTNDKQIQEKVSINGDSFALLFDGYVTTTIPSKGAYLIDYECDNESKITWNRETGELSISKNTWVTENCSLTFKTKPLVSELPQGSYIAYEGNNGCLKDGEKEKTLDGTLTAESENENSCLGYNANATTNGSRDSNFGTYGFCYDPNYRFYVNGWRIAYTDLGRAYIISAGSPECNERPISSGNKKYITVANISAKKYCNSTFVDDCTSDTDVHAINDTDFNKMTAQMTNTAGGYLYKKIEGATKCGGVFSNELCGYNNDLFDNGGYYWLAAANPSKSTYAVDWNPCDRRRIGTFDLTHPYGLRPVIRLSSSVYVTGGAGTMDDPYTIDINIDS